MRYLSLAEVTELHRLVIEAFGGSKGIRDLGALEAAIAQPRMSFGGEELYPTIVEKAAAEILDMPSSWSQKTAPAPGADGLEESLIEFGMDGNRQSWTKERRPMLKLIRGSTF